MMATKRVRNFATLERPVAFCRAGPAMAPWRVSARVTESVDATQVVAPFGGGGHARRAGCTIELPLAEARLAILGWSEELLRKG